MYSLGYLITRVEVKEEVKQEVKELDCPWWWYIYIPNIYDKDKYVEDYAGMNYIPPTMKGKSRTKMRWAMRSRADSFANGIMWADLGND